MVGRTKVDTIGQIVGYKKRENKGCKIIDSYSTVGRVSDKRKIIQNIS